MFFAAKIKGARNCVPEKDMEKTADRNEKRGDTFAVSPDS